MNGLEAQSCYCGKKCQVKTSWTDKHPGRRFQVCPCSGASNCGYWEWFDPEMCHHCKAIIPGLLRKNTKMEEELKKSKSWTRKLWVALIVTWIVVIVKIIEA